MKAFYFSNKEKVLRYDDGREIEVGVTHEVEGELVPCKNGLHASKRLIDALQYAPGNVLWLVDVEDCVEGGDKLCARKRTYLAEFDAEDLLREFARKQALINIEKVKPYCSEEEYKTLLHYLETGEGREAAYSAADSAYSADSAAYSADSAAYSAAHSAAYSALSASDSAAYSAYSAAHWAAYSAATSKANDMLTEMVVEATGWECH